MAGRRRPSGQAAQIGQLFAEGLSKRAIARQLGIGRTSVRRILQATRGGRGDATPTARDRGQAGAEGGPG